jgi:ATP-binding cassette, subfamily B, bacterial PglK
MNIFHKIISLLQGSYTQIYTLGFIFLIISIFEMVGLSLVVTYVSIITSKSSLIELIDWMYVNFGMVILEKELILYTGFFLVTVFSIKTMIILLSNSKIINFTQKQHQLLQLTLLSVYQKMSYSVYTKRNSSEYVYNIQTLAHQYVESVLLPIIRVLSDGIVGLAIILYLAYANFLAFILMLFLFSLVVFAYDSIFKLKIKQYGKLSNASSKAVIQSINESLGGLKEIRTLGKEEFFFNKVKDDTDKYVFNNIKKEVIVSSPKYLLEFFVVFFLALLSSVSLLVDGSSELLISTLALFAIASLRILPMVTTLINSLIRLRFNHSSVSILYNDIISKEFNTSKDNLFFDEFKSLEVRGISFNYDDKVILKNIDFEIKKGDAVGIIGKSGSGKTTLIDILLGLHSPSTGKILINKCDINRVLSAWRGQIAYLPQDVFLIDDTLESNIAFGVPKEDIDKKLVAESLNIASLNDVVGQLSEGVLSKVGERGIMLSGGQKQRVAIARAHYHGRNILIMDESTSSLDNDTEKEIIREIKKLKGVKTMIIIAHRYTTIEHCDYIFEINKEGLTKIEK